MTAKEMMRKLAEMNVICIVREEENYMVVEDPESYAGTAYINFDENGNAKEVN